jgi:hypothetical protein
MPEQDSLSVVPLNIKMAYGRSNHPGSTTILVATEFKEGCLGGQLGGRFEHDSGFELESSAIVNKCHREQVPS